MKNLLLTVLLFSSLSSGAQYYYKDILGAEEITARVKLYAAQGIKRINATGIDPFGAPARDFSEVQEIKDNGKSLKISTINGRSLSTFLYEFDNNGRLLSTTDINAGLKSTSTYTYDAEGRIITIRNNIVDSLQGFTQTETHAWQYKNGKPEKMWRVVDNADSLEVRFKTDESGNVTEEQNFKHGAAADPVYYYYDDQNRLTDIVRYNAKAKKLLPDYMFEYDEANRVIQKITTLSAGNLGYLTWRYLYNEKGLKTKEALFNKEKKLQGRIEYSYN